MWDALGRQVAGRNYPPTNKNTLICALTEEWDKLPQQLLDNVVQKVWAPSDDCVETIPETSWMKAILMEARNTIFRRNDSIFLENGGLLNHLDGWTSIKEACWASENDENSLLFLLASFRDELMLQIATVRKIKDLKLSMRWSFDDRKL
ncbi:hypothetical protein TNCV_2144261 [Trichonephila clavipes]|nr:hypothetical protein TNCV_2144261 [Trichonephila clavipes]